MSQLWRRARNSHLFKFGLPFFTFMVIAPFGLKEFQSLRISERDKKQHFLSIEEEYKIDRKQIAKFSIEEELRKTNEKLDINQWQNKRISRPWEE